MQNQPPIPTLFLDKFPSENPHDWIELGRGIFEWSVFKIYEASLWVRTEGGGGRSGKGNVYDPNGHFILQLRYLRPISGEQLCDASMSEIRRLYPEHASFFEAWQFNLNSVSPNIERGDLLVLEFHNEAGLRVFLNQDLLGEICDPVFAKALAGVWLDSRTKVPKLRQRLLALDNG